MDWFTQLTGFEERSYQETKSALKIEDNQLISLVNNASYQIGELEVVSLGSLRREVDSLGGQTGKCSVEIVTGDVQELHRLPKNTGSLFQVASQFNLLEMSGPDISPEHGVTRYQYDHTQGPACAIAAGAATIYRNYFAKTDNQEGQTSEKQIDTLKALGTALSKKLDTSLDKLWLMKNGYVIPSRKGLGEINTLLDKLPPHEINTLRSLLEIGVHRYVEVNEPENQSPLFVSQAFCSALPVAYNQFDSSEWEPFANLVLEAAYEATLLEAVLNSKRTKCNVVFLTFLGGGAFGNPVNWIIAAIRRSLKLVANYDLRVKLVSYREPSSAICSLVNEFN
jgi:hypothetical protein